MPYKIYAIGLQKTQPISRKNYRPKTSLAISAQIISFRTKPQSEPQNFRRYR